MHNGISFICFMLDCICFYMAFSYFVYIVDNFGDGGLIMSKPMYCPLTMIDKHAQIYSCNPYCAWAIESKDGKSYSCAVAVQALYEKDICPNTCLFEEEENE